MALLPYQVAPCAHLTEILRAHGATLDASDTGTGKSFVGAHVALNLDLPTGIVCPKAVIPSWEAACKAVGLTPAFIINYDKLIPGNTPWVHRLGKRLTWNFAGLVIFDEIDRAKSYSSLTAKLVIAAWKTRVIRCHCISATAVQNPLDMRTLGFLLDLHQDHNFWPWAIARGAKKNRWNGYMCNPTKEVMEEIHHCIFPSKGVRVRISELGDAFPENKIIVESVGVDCAKEINEIYAAAKAEIAELMLKAEGDKVNAFTIALRARQKSELAKAPAIVEQARSLMAEGRSVAVFVNYNATLELIANALGTDCIIRGQEAEVRKENLEKFQSNESKIIILNLQAGGVGISLHDIHGGHPRAALICPTYNARNLKQALGRVHRSGGKTSCLQKLIFAADTIEDNIAKALKNKLQAIDTVNDLDTDDTLSWYLTQL